MRGFTVDGSRWNGRCVSIPNSRRRRAASHDPAQLEIAALAGLLQRFGPHLRRPHCDTLKGSKHANMKELRFTLPDGEWRIAFAFDRERNAILLVGGSKSGMSEA